MHSGQNCKEVYGRFLVTSTFAFFHNCIGNNLLLNCANHLGNNPKIKIFSIEINYTNHLGHKNISQNIHNQFNEAHFLNL